MRIRIPAWHSVPGGIFFAPEDARSWRAVASLDYQFSAAILRKHRNAINATGLDIQWKPSIRAYRDLWDEINGASAWAANPWAGVVEFRKVQI
ncbi:hypothetical protein [Cupriavidus sp. YAF13]|uniref:hypothetical protein n=1 Tax=Cupriavidus sp. YAF13 TaxID=3233075 RepID=UPI003F8EBBA1